jgi:mono/diheme cytochrome c family protein
MQPFFIKSLLSLAVLLFSVIGVYTMFEIYGRTEKRQNAELFRKVHRINGIVFILLNAFISLLCISFVLKTKTEPSLRGMFHSVFGISVLLLTVFKILASGPYRQFYARLQTAGLALAFMSVMAFASSGGYYLLITEFGTKQMGKEDRRSEASNDRNNASLLTDPSLASQGKELYESKCSFCHDAFSSKQGVGPGHKGILKNMALPVSGKPAVPENIAGQLRNPYRDMPSFSYLTDDEVRALISYMSTL